PSGWRSAGEGSIPSATTTSTTSRPATTANVPRTPTRLAAAPTTGPSSAPKTAAPIAVPIVWPRRSLGVASASQASPPAQVSDEPKPCEDRAPCAPARGEDAAGNRAGEDAEAVRGHERADAALGKVVRLLEVGQQRRERRVQGGVHHHDHTDERQQAAHRPRLPAVPTGEPEAAEIGRRPPDLTRSARALRITPPRGRRPVCPGP